MSQVDADSVRAMHMIEETFHIETARHSAATKIARAYRRHRAMMQAQLQQQQQQQQHIAAVSLQRSPICPFLCLIARSVEGPSLSICPILSCPALFFLLLRSAQSFPWIPRAQVSAQEHRADHQARDTGWSRIPAGH